MRAMPRSFTPLLRVWISSVPSDRFEVGPGLRVQRPQIQPIPIVVTMNASDCRADRRRLAGRTGLGDRLSLSLPLSHRLGSPRLFGAHLPDVLTTPTPAEFADISDLRICKQRPSPVTQGLGVSASSKLTRLIGCGSSSFRPVGSLPACSPSNLAAGQAPVRSVVNRLIRRVGLSPTYYAPFAGCCGWPVYRVGRKSFPFFLFFKQLGFFMKFIICSP